MTSGWRCSSASWRDCAPRTLSRDCSSTSSTWAAGRSRPSRSDATMIELFKNPNYDFIGKRKWAYYFSIKITLIGLISLVAKGGLRYDIDFTGGTLIQVRFEQAPSAAQTRSTPSQIHLGESALQRLG